MRRQLATALCMVFAAAVGAQAAPVLGSPDGRLQVDLHVTEGRTLEYAIARDGKPVLLPSALGLQLADADLTNALQLDSTSPITQVLEQYSMMTGKRRAVVYTANQRIFSVRNARGQKIEIALRVSNDGVAFRYIAGAAATVHQQLRAESTTFALPPASTAWLQPMQVAQTGWMNTNPAYEEHYRMQIAAGTPSPSAAGWVFPALFNTGDNWVLLSEAGMDGMFHGSRLQADSTGGVYRIGGPMAAEVVPGGALLAEADGTLVSPWRLIAIGSLATLVESTLGTDLAAPAIAFDAARIAPGHAAWSWVLLKDRATVFEVQKQFIDYAADMHWNYTLIDSGWDTTIGYEKIAQLAAYAARKNVGLLLWYNSSGAWNRTVMTPKGALLTHAQRMAEFARLRTLGIKGIKVDFFGGDGKSMIAYYLDILRDAADYGLLVNFHGATLPRGWSRTYPNLMTAEAVKGLEFTTFTQADQDAMATHVAMLPYTRNIFDPMDFTPTVFGDVPNIRRATRNGFELALPVLLLSGIQHFGETPQGMAGVPSYVKAYMQTLPRSWDDSKFITGFPGKYTVIARRAGTTWYVAGINAEDADRSVTLDLAFLGARTGTLITDGESAREFSRRDIAGGKNAQIIMRAHGGFVAVFN